MAKQDVATTVIILLLSILVLKYIICVQQQYQAFEIGHNHIKYHANWTEANGQLPHVNQLQKAYNLQGIKHLDLSLSMSSLSFAKIKAILPVRFNPYETIKINLANNPIGTEGADYVLSLIPNGVSSLELSFDSIQADNGLGEVLARRLNNLNSLKKLKLSLILAIKNDTAFDSYLRFGRLGEKLQSYSLVVIGNGLSQESIGFLQTHLSRANLTSLDLNFYSNKLGASGAEIVAKSILTQKHLKQLSLDFYFNNITQTGTQSLCKSILEINNPELKTLNFNLDFNYIKNEGAKAVGNMLSNMNNLKTLHLGVASKNFGYLGFKYLVNGMRNLTELQDLSFKCGVNRVGGLGAQITRDLLYKLKKLTTLSLHFYQNYVGDEGLIQLTKAVVALQHLDHVYLNFGFNGAQGYGLIKSLQLLAKKTFSELFVSFSSNEFQDSEINLIKDDLRQIIKKTKHFEFQFMQTAISKRKAAQLEKLFLNAVKSTANHATINVNSVITEEEEAKYNKTATDRQEKLQKLVEADEKGNIQGLVAPAGETQQNEQTQINSEQKSQQKANTQTITQTVNQEKVIDSKNSQAQL